MSHHIQALIASSDILESIQRTYPAARVIPLPQNLALLPVTKAFADDIAQIKSSSVRLAFHQFTQLTEAVAEFAKELSATAPVVYAETDYFGGRGAQAAIVWKNGEVVFGPLVTKNIDDDQQGVFATTLSDEAINQALRRIGVVLTSTRDEFDAVGLGRYRSNDDWLKATVDHQ
jgi:hypothetical protein